MGKEYEAKFLDVNIESLRKKNLKNEDVSVKL